MAGGNGLKARQIKDEIPSVQKKLNAFAELLAHHNIFFESKAEFVKLLHEGVIRRADGTRFSSEVSFEMFESYLNDQEGSLITAQKLQNELKQDQYTQGSYTENFDETGYEGYYITTDQLGDLKKTLDFIYSSQKDSDDYKDLNGLYSMLLERYEKVSGINEVEIDGLPGAQAAWRTTENAILVSKDEYDQLKDLQDTVYARSYRNMLLYCRDNKVQGLNFTGMMESSNTEKNPPKVLTESICRANVGSEIIRDEILEAVNAVKKDLNDTDGIFTFNNSKEFKDLISALNSFSDRFKEAKTLDEMKAVFTKSPAEGKPSILDSVEAYIEQKEKKSGDLSSTQIQRLGMCRHLRGIYNILNSVRDLNASCRQDILKDKIANKAVMGLMDHMKGSLFNLNFKDSESFDKLYDEFADSSRLNAAAISDLSSMAKKHPGKISEILKPSLIQYRNKGSAAMLETEAKAHLSAIEKQRNSKGLDINMPAIYEFMIRRTNSMMAELESFDSFHHSPEYNDFTDSLVNARGYLISDAANLNNVSRESLINAMAKVGKCAEAYIEKHSDTDLGNLNRKVLKRASIASEIKVINKYLQSTDKPNIREMASILYQHQRTQEEEIAKLDNRTEFPLPDSPKTMNKHLRDFHAHEIQRSDISGETWNKMLKVEKYNDQISKVLLVDETDLLKNLTKQAKDNPDLKTNELTSNIVNAAINGKSVSEFQAVAEKAHMERNKEIKQIKESPFFNF